MHNKFTVAPKQIGPQTFPCDLSVYRSNITDSDNRATRLDYIEIHLGIYIDNLDFYSTNSAQ